MFFLVIFSQFRPFCFELPVAMMYFGAIIALAAAVQAHGDHEQEPIAGPHKSLWYNTLPGDGGTQVRTDMQTP